MKKYLYVPAACALLAVSCYPQHPLTKGPAANNDTYKVEYLFEHEGCKVYRFFDRGNYIYYTNCNGEAITRTDSTAIHNSIRVKK
ncbi:MAG TPA: DUF4884 domain-containing protein [Puia sp.]|jgi:hypothetical protein